VSFTAKDVMIAASITLQDQTNVRWPPTELLGYLNEGIREVANVKPNAATQTVQISLVSGAKQSLSSAYTFIAQAVRNVATGQPIQSLPSTDILDSMLPGWSNAAVMPFDASVRYIINDPTDPRTFYVAPGNNAAGQIEVVVGVLPAEVPPGANPATISTYTGVVGLPDAYRNCLIDYVIYRAFAKDAALPGADARAVSHKGLFDAALSSIGAGEAALVQA
jgi:hypothetical protein